MHTPQPLDGPEHLARIMLRKDLLAQGHSDRSIKRLVQDEALAWVRHGSYVDHSCWVGLDERGRHVVRTRAVLARAKAPSVLSHSSALVLWDVPVWDIGLDVIETTRLDGRAGRAEAGVRPHAGHLRAKDVTMRHGLALTSAARTVLDNIAAQDTEHGLVIANHFLHHEIVTVPELDDCELFMRQWPDTLGKQHVLRLADSRIESVLESRTLFLIWDQGLPMPTPQWFVHGPGSQVVARLDFAWPKRKVWLECDGKEKYVKFLRDGETVVDAVLREKRRERMIEQLTGWRCIRITWADLYDPARLAARIRAELSRMAA